MSKTREELEKHWRDAFRKPENRIADKLERALTGNRPTDPLADPMFLTVEQADEREAALQAVDVWRSSGPFTQAHDVTLVFNGQRVTAYDFINWRDRMIYALLERGIDARTIAAYCHATADDVAEVAQRHGIALS